MIIIFLGAPGSGKGTQTAMISNEFKIPSISIGDCLRKEVGLRSKTGDMVSSYMSSGELVPDNLVLDIVRGRISNEDCKDGFILDGFPRNLNQAMILNEMLSSIGKEVSLVFNLEVEDGILLKRIVGRFSCKSCGTIYNKYFKKTATKDTCDKCNSNNFVSRVDDKESVLLTRLKLYRKITSRLVAFYQKNNLIISIDALKSAPLIFEEIANAINLYKKEASNSTNI